MLSAIIQWLSLNCRVAASLLDFNLSSLRMLVMAHRCSLTLRSSSNVSVLTEWVYVWVYYVAPAWLLGRLKPPLNVWSVLLSDLPPAVAFFRPALDSNPEFMHNCRVCAAQGVSCASTAWPTFRTLSYTTADTFSPMFHSVVTLFSWACSTTVVCSCRSATASSSSSSWIQDTKLVSRTKDAFFQSSSILWAVTVM